MPHFKGQELDFPLIPDFTIDFKYFIVKKTKNKKHGITCIFNYLRFESWVLNWPMEVDFRVKI